MNSLSRLVRIAVLMNQSLSGRGPVMQLLLASVREVIPFDAATLMLKIEDSLVPLATIGLLPEARAKRFAIAEHPRLFQIFNSNRPVKFPKNSPLPDPFDDMIEICPEGLHRVHACLGLPLIVENQTIGVFTADSLSPDIFNDLSDEFLQMLSALTGSILRTAILIEKLEEKATREGIVAKDLMKQANLRGGELIGLHPLMEKLREDILTVSKSDLSVLITGETGTGKELIARSIHNFSKRSARQLIYVNCASLPDAIAESELFGHMKGPFTGAINERPGKFEVADEGTLFLDEIGELPLNIQAKLLRALQEGEIQRVGDNKFRRVDVRVIAATNRDLVQEIKSGRFRSDLYHRLNVYPIKSPPLRLHKTDIPILCGHFCDINQRKLGTRPFRLSTEALNLFMNYSWPGNVRELKNILSRACLKCSVAKRREVSKYFVITEDIIRKEFPVDDRSEINFTQTGPTNFDHDGPSTQFNFKQSVELFKRKLILDAIQRNNGNMSKAARELGLDRSNFHHLRKKLGS